VDLAKVADELYGLGLPEFTPARDARSSEARREGDRDSAQAIKSLKKPSAAAWATNILVRESSDELRQMSELGARMREAQASLSAADIRSLGRQRHQILSGLARQARELAAQRGHPISEAATRQVEETLTAALADADATAAVLSGRLVRSLEHAGIGSVDLTGAVGGPQAAPVAAPTAKGTGRVAAKRRSEHGDEIETAKTALADARARKRDAEATLRAAEKAQRSAAESHAANEADVRRLEREVSAARRASERSQADLEKAGSALDSARGALEGSAHDVEQAEAALSGMLSR
jgi:hypothetical protein